MRLDLNEEHTGRMANGLCDSISMKNIQGGWLMAYVTMKNIQGGWLMTCVTMKNIQGGWLMACETRLSIHLSLANHDSENTYCSRSHFVSSRVSLAIPIHHNS